MALHHLSEAAPLFVRHSGPAVCLAVPHCLPAELKRPKDWWKLGYASDGIPDRPVDYVMRVHVRNMTKERFVREFEKPNRWVSGRPSETAAGQRRQSDV